MRVPDLGVMEKNHQPYHCASTGNTASSWDVLIKQKKSSRPSPYLLQKMFLLKVKFNILHVPQFTVSQEVNQNPTYLITSQNPTTFSAKSFPKVFTFVLLVIQMNWTSTLYWVSTQTWFRLSQNLLELVQSQGGNQSLIQSLQLSLPTTRSPCVSLP